MFFVSFSFNVSHGRMNEWTVATHQRIAIQRNPPLTPSFTRLQSLILTNTLIIPVLYPILASLSSSLHTLSISHCKYSRTGIWADSVPILPTPTPIHPIPTNISTILIFRVCQSRSSHLGRSGIPRVPWRRYILSTSSAHPHSPHSPYPSRWFFLVEERCREGGPSSQFERNSSQFERGVLSLQCGDDGKLGSFS